MTIVAPSSAGPAVVGGAGALFQVLRDGRARTRADLVAETGLARSTVAARLEVLLATALLAPAGEADSTGGRPPTRFVFNPDARVVLAADLGATHARLGVTNLAGTTLAAHNADLDITTGPDKVLDWVAAELRLLLGRAGRAMGDVVGMGIGLPGPVEHSTGRPVNPPIMPGWDAFAVPERLEGLLGVPVLVDNDVNIMALGEQWSQWSEVEHLLFVKVATGIGCGIVSNGVLHRGAQGAAGDLGHVQVPHGADIACTCGNTGCLEAVASGSALARRLRSLGIDATGSRDVVALARAGRVEAIQLLRQAGRDIGEVLATCVSLLNPSVVVVGGLVAEAGEHLLAGVREVVYRRSLPLATQHLLIASSRTGEQAGVIGAAVMVLEHVLSPAAVDASLTAAAAATAN